MRPRGTLGVALVAAVALSGCAAAGVPRTAPVTSPPGPAGLPGPGSVRAGRFAVPVALDGGALRVDPPPPGLRPTVPRSTAAAEIWASPAVQGSRSGAVLGLGLVTLRRSAVGVPRVTRAPAWVGFAWGGVTSCPAMTAPPSPAPSLPSGGYVAVAVMAGASRPGGFTYTARSSICGEPPHGPRVAPATHVVSIPWRLLGTAGSSVRLAYTPPPCGSLFQVEGGGSDFGMRATIEVEATVPDAPRACPSPASGTTDLPLAPPQGPPLPGTPTLRHAKLGPVRQIQL